MIQVHIFLSGKQSGKQNALFLELHVTINIIVLTLASKSKQQIYSNVWKKLFQFLNVLLFLCSINYFYNDKSETFKSIYHFIFHAIHRLLFLEKYMFYLCTCASICCLPICYSIIIYKTHHFWICKIILCIMYFSIPTLGHFQYVVLFCINFEHLQFRHHLLLYWY